MSDSMWIAVAVAAICLLGAVGLMSQVFIHSSANGRDVKVACVSHGGSWVEGQCVQGARP